ncbi:MAG: 50S ribosomal protein L19 [bacterium]|nr:50S ribosomal protein L19 [Candidatus Aquidulcis sp.]
MDQIRTLTDAQMKSDLPEIKTGDTVKVSAKVVEGNRERIQVFEGTVMRLRGGGLGLSITVRRIASGVGVERTFKVHSPRIEKIEVVRHGVSNRAQLYFLRDRVGKQSSLRERRDSATDIAKSEVKAAAKRAMKEEADALTAAAALAVQDAAAAATAAEVGAEAPVAEAVETVAEDAAPQSAPEEAPSAEASEKASE